MLPIIFASKKEGSLKKPFHICEPELGKLYDLFDPSDSIGTI